MPSYPELGSKPLRPSLFYIPVLLVALLFTATYFNSYLSNHESDYWFEQSAVVSQNGLERYSKTIPFIPKVWVSYDYQSVYYQNRLLDGRFDDGAEGVTSEKAGLDYVHQFYPVGKTIQILINARNPAMPRSTIYQQREIPWWFLGRMVFFWLLFIFLFWKGTIQPAMARANAENNRRW